MHALRRLLLGERGYDALPSHEPDSGSVHEALESLSTPTGLLGPGAVSGRPREWLVVDAEARCSSVVVDKHELVSQLGITYRDLRILDPHVATPYPSSILSREKAIMLNLESLRCIVCKDRVWVLSVPSPGKPLNCGTTLSADNFFVKDLLTRLARPGLPALKSGIDRHLPFELRAMESALAAAVRTLEVETQLLERDTGPALTRLMLRVARKELNTVRHAKVAVAKLLTRISRIKKELEDLLDDDEDMRDLHLARREDQKAAAEAAAQAGSERDPAEAAEAAGGDMFVMDPPLRSAFEPAAGRSPGRQAAARGERARPVSQQQQQQPPLRQALAAAAAQAEAAGLLAPADSAPQPIAAAATAGAAAPPAPEPLPVAMSAPATEMPSMERRPSLARRRTGHWRGLQDVATLVGVLRGLGPAGAGLHLAEVLDPDDITGCESMLEAYFLQVDHLLSRLSALEGRISGTEDQLNIEMDHRRNELQALDLAITAFMSSLAFISMIGGVYGMNLRNGLEESQVAFYTTVSVTILVAFVLLLGILLYARSKRLLFIPVTV